MPKALAKFWSNGKVRNPDERSRSGVDEARNQFGQDIHPAKRLPYLRISVSWIILRFSEIIVST